MALEPRSLIFLLALQSFYLAPVIADEVQSIINDANQSIQANEKSQALGTLVNLMHTTIQTGTSGKNTDLAPGIVSILEKRELIAAGVQTVSDALTLLPGFYKPEPELTDDEPVLRGIGGIFTGSSGKIRYLVNGSVMNNNISANSSLVLQMPVEQVERIEVLRGPGAAIHGEHALLGVINIVTRQDDEQAYVRATSFDSYTAGGSFIIQHTDGLRSVFNLAYSETGGANINSGPDYLHILGQKGVSNAPGQPNNARRLISGFYDLSGENWTLSAFLLDEDRGDGFGALNVLSQPQKYVQSATQRGVEFKANQTLDQWTVDYQFATKYFRREYDKLMILPPNPFGIYKNGLLGSSIEAEQRYEMGVDFSRTAMNHRLLLGFDFARSEASDIHYASNFLDQSPIPGTRLPTPLSGIKAQPLGLEDRARNVISVFFSDQYQFNNKVELVGGFRVDHYSDIRDPTLFSPRFSASYQRSEQNSFKFQLARAFRPPSFSELHYLIGAGEDGPAGNPDLDSETIDTLELSHTFRLPGTVLRTTLFASEISGLIRLDQSVRYQNALDIKSSGMEFEIEHRPRSGLLWFGNLSYVDAEDKQTGEPLEGSTNWLGNAGITWQPTGRYSSTLRYQYVGERIRSPMDTRADLSADSTWNISGYIKDFLFAGLGLRLGINNLFDEDTRNPSEIKGYSNDYPGAGREYWLQLSMSLD